jgi:ubiquinone/menaquinone biosynthesis C-methylase UbiE
VNNHYTEPSRLTRLFHRLVYDPLRARYLRRVVDSLRLSGSEKVLDFGSGAGSEAVYIVGALNRGGGLTCLDVSTTWLAEARRRLRHAPNVEFVAGDVREAALSEAAFDIVLAHYVLHDVDRSALPATLMALARSIRPGGRFVAVEPLRSRHVHASLSAGELTELMAAAGLTKVSSEEIDSLPGPAALSVFERAA